MWLTSIGLALSGVGSQISLSLLTGAWASSKPLRAPDKRAQEALRARRVLSPKRHESDPLAASVSVTIIHYRCCFQMKCHWASWKDYIWLCHCCVIPFDPVRSVVKKVAQYMADVLEDSRDKVQENLLANGGEASDTAHRAQCFTGHRWEHLS